MEQLQQREQSEWTRVAQVQHIQRRK